jgi:hypothetical protein
MAREFGQGLGRKAAQAVRDASDATRGAFNKVVAGKAGKGPA